MIKHKKPRKRQGPFEYQRNIYRSQLFDLETNLCLLRNSMAINGLPHLTRSEGEQLTNMIRILTQIIFKYVLIDSSRFAKVK